jgi:NADH dehydrogenase
VRALVHRHAALDVDERVAGELGDPRSLDRAVTDVDAIVHLAARTHARSDRAYDEVNVLGTRHLADAAVKAGKPFLLHVSTRAISPSGGGYSRSKLQSEEIVRAALPEAAIVRLPEIYGAPGREGVNRIIDSARRDKPVFVIAGAFEIRPVFVDDAVAALGAALDRPRCRGKTYTLAGVERFTMRTFAEECVRILGSRSRVVDIPYAFARTLGFLARVMPLPLFPDQLERLRSPKPDLSPEAALDLGFSARPLDEGVLGSAASLAPEGAPSPQVGA